jgi:uncharacterized protein YbbK (DUF523 family)
MKKVLQCAWLRKLSIDFKPKILISACLLGEKVRYDGKIKKYDLSKLEKYYDFVSCCPEVDGGLKIPREASEILKDGRVMNSGGTDASKAFENGAKKALYLAFFHDIKIALLKSKSPSCSNKMIYDGTFSGSLKEGIGKTTEILLLHDIEVFDEMQIDKILSKL